MKFSFNLMKSLEDLKNQLERGMNRLTLSDNFQSFITTVEILNSQEVSIRNQLKFVPRHRIIIRQSGNGFVTDGDTAWTNDFVYLKNNGPSTTTVTVVFLA
jgi:hypothetical protein